MSQFKPLVGSVLERKPSGNTSSTAKFPQNSKSGFPVVQHRSQSAFARSRDVSLVKNSSRTQSRPAAPPAVEPAPAPRPDDWRAQISEENSRKVAVMTEEEREGERREIVEKFGPNIADVLKRAREKRERDRAASQSTISYDTPPSSGDIQSDSSHSGRGRLPIGEAAESSSSADDSGARVESSDSDLVQVARRARSRSPTRPILSTPTSRATSPSRHSRKLRFADITPSDVFVYESQPSSPKRRAILALPPPPPGGNDAISLGTYTGQLNSQSAPPDLVKHDVVEAADPGTLASTITASSLSVTFIHPSRDDQPEEGTAEDIRRRFFPNMPANDPNLAWMSASPPRVDSSDGIRFDLTGTPIPPDLSETLPTHLGLHHHAEGSRAGYTLDDIFLLSRSTVPSQRTTMLGVLARIVRRLGRRAAGDGLDLLTGKEEEVRTRALAAGAEAIGPKGSIAAIAIDVLWECIVGWDEHLDTIDGVELQPEPKDGAKDALATLQLDFFLGQVSSVFGAAALPHESLVRILEIARRLARHTAAIAETIVKTPSFLSNMIRLFILTPIPPPADSMPPLPLAIRTLTTLASASRTAASALVDPADALLRYISLLPPSSTFPPPLACTLLSETLTFYAVLASYGFYAHTATATRELFSRLTVYVLSPECNSQAVRASYATLLGHWIVCATDPHRTTPEHDILWSQVTAWGWAADLAKLAEILGDSERDRSVWDATWSALASWLEGARVNSVRGGEDERAAVVGAAGFRSGFENGVQKHVVDQAMTVLRTLTSEVGNGKKPEDISRLRTLALAAQTLTSVIRLWLACCPLGPLPSPPFSLPFEELGELTFSLACSPLLSAKYEGDAPLYLHVFCRSFTALLAQYAAMLGKIPETGDGRWLGIAAGILVNLMPGDEELAQDLLSSILDLINPDFLRSKGLPAPAIIWEQGGMSVIRPFLVSHLSPMSTAEDQDPFIGPLTPTPRSIKIVLTQMLPPAWAVQRRTPTAGLPYPRDWPFLPLEHLLKSGTSPIWQHLPSSWNASETEVVRATLLLATVIRGALVVNGLDSFAARRAEAIFGCMRVFMLEHGQVQGAPTEDVPSAASSNNEVFRDTAVSALLEDFLAPYTLHSSPDGLSALPAAAIDADLESAAAPYLGTGTPFFQFYTDFVALYDAVSFGHPTFGTLLLSPLTRAYAMDYRRLVFVENAQILRSVQTFIDRVLGSRLGTFLWPVEDDAQVLGAYLGFLIGRSGRGTLSTFLRWLVAHHIAANIWPDLRQESETAASTLEDRARKLLEAITVQGRIGDIRDTAGYSQRTVGDAVLPPACFDAAPKEVRLQRLNWVRSWAKSSVIEKLEGLLG